MSWTWLFLAIAWEVCGTTSMRLSAGFTRWVPSVLVFVFYGFSFASFILALKGIPLSTAYAIWAGVGTATIAVIGVVMFQEAATLAKALFIATIMIGVVGLRFFGRE